MGDEEFEEFADFSKQSGHWDHSNYKLVHAITPFEENKSFLEQVEYGGILCGLRQDDLYLPNSSSRRLLMNNSMDSSSSPDTFLRNPLLLLPPGCSSNSTLWTSSDDDDDNDSDELDLASYHPHLSRRPGIRWQDADGQLPLDSVICHADDVEDAATTTTAAITAYGFPGADLLRTSRISGCEWTGPPLKPFISEPLPPPPGIVHRVLQSSLKHPSSALDLRPTQRNRRRKLPELPKDRKPLQKIRQASLLEELRESCQKRRRDKLTVSDLLHSVIDAAAQKQEPPPDLPPSFILNLVKTEDLESAFHNNSSSKTKSAPSCSCPVRHRCCGGGGGVLLDEDDEDGGGGEGKFGGNDSGNSTSHSPEEALLLQQQRQQRQHNQRSREGGGERSKDRILLPARLDQLDPTHRGLHRFIPRHCDEIEVDLGDPIFVQKEAEDLWCEGANLRTLQVGIFPLAHVVDMDYDDFVSPQQQGQQRSATKKERYLLQYIGSVETKRFRGNEVLRESVRRILGAKTPPRKHACILEISDKGIKMMDKSRVVDLSHPTSQDYFYNLRNVTFCGFHPSSSQYFGFVTKHPRLPKFACHVFLGEGSTQHIAEACGRAFSRFYQKFADNAFPVEDIYLE